MNKIYCLFDEKYVKNLFREKILPLYPDFLDIKKIKIRAPKKHIWENTYHVVIEFETTFKNKKARDIVLPIYCSAHSNEPRKNVYDALKYLWEHNFGVGYLSVPRPLFYSEEFQGTFYRGVRGHNLYYYIRKKNYSEIEDIIPKAAAWFAKLHNLPARSARNFNKENSRVKTVIPGVSHILERVQQSYPEYFNVCEKAYKYFIKQEEEFFLSSGQCWLVHGDAHPENIIKMSRRKLAVIDFTDLCLSDFARDLGAFLQQLEYMMNRKILNPKYAEKIKKLFLDNYFKNVKIKPSNSLQKRINNYYNWTAIRTAIFFLLKDKCEPGRAKPIIQNVCENLNIKI